MTRGLVPTLSPPGSVHALRCCERSRRRTPNSVVPSKGRMGVLRIRAIHARAVLQPSRADGSRSVTFRGLARRPSFQRDEPKARGFRRARADRLRPVRRWPGRWMPAKPHALSSSVELGVEASGSRRMAPTIDRQRHVPSVSMGREKARRWRDTARELLDRLLQGGVVRGGEAIGVPMS